MKRVVCLFSHCDDEYLVSEHLQKWRKDGHDIKIFYLTKDLTNPGIREQESTRYLQKLGIKEPNFLYHTVDVKDGRLPYHLFEVYRELQNYLQPDDILLTPAWEGGHQDHDATFLIGSKLCESLSKSQHWVFSLYHGARTSGRFFSVASPIVDHIMECHSIKMSSLSSLLNCILVFKRYPSQWRSWIGLAPLLLWERLFKTHEHIFRIKDFVILHRPHLGELLYERYQRMTWIDFLEQKKRFLSDNQQSAV